ncbi:hypothetical protein [Duganella vulcania]|uniref:Uncharacterized protein n=1 Tax=Duganella vulcania TaxID=2692166 RepID=A0A845GQK2_9BURK|nr:hypothetical protein [Duganella vulcania]MYM95682.1 hypothetical protein [Duganella vulcania]
MKNMYSMLPLFAALWVTLPAVAGPETLERCPPAAKPWLPAGVSQNVCYDAEGAFFGDHASLAAVKVYMTVNSPARNRHEDIATAVIILRAEASPPVAGR